MRQARQMESRRHWFRHRRGHQSTERPSGRLLWLHSEEASDVTSLIALVRRLSRSSKDTSFLVTTSEDLDYEINLEEGLDAVFQAIGPHKQPGWINRFLKHWKPDAAILVASLPSPNYILALGQRNIPLLMVNGTISMRTYRTWRHYPRLIGPMLRELSVVLAPTRAEGARFRRLGARNVIVSGGLKYDGRAASTDPRALEALKKSLSPRSIWIAACSTVYETLTALEAHKSLQANHPHLLSIISPAGMTDTEFRSLADAAELKVSGGSEACGIDPMADIHLPADATDLHNLYSLADVAFVGGTESHKNGDDPIIAASQGAVVLHGPNMHRYQKAVSDLQAAGAAQTVRDAADLIRTVDRLLATPDLIRQRSIAGRHVAQTETEMVDRVMDHIHSTLATK